MRKNFMKYIAVVMLMFSFNTIIINASEVETDVNTIEGSSAKGEDQLVEFGDDKVRTAVGVAAGVDSDSITVGDMKKVKSLDIGGHGMPIYYVSDLSGLEYATNLEHLEVYGSNVTDLTPISNLTKLQYLDVGLGQISDISMLSNLTNLTHLNISSNQITDVSVLENFKKLEYLDARVNNITSIQSLTNLTSLEYLNLASNSELSDFSSLSGLTNITELNVNYTKFGDDGVSQIADLLKIEKLYIRSTDVTAIDVVSKFTELTKLDISSTKISDISALTELTKLNELSAERCEIVDLTPLEKLTDLESLEIRNNKIESVEPLRNLTKLETLDVAYNKISDISPLASLTNVDEVDLGNQTIILDDLAIDAPEEIFSSVFNINGDEIKVSLGTAYVGSTKLMGSFKEMQTIGTTEDVYSGDIIQTVTVGDVSNLTGDPTAVIDEGKVLTDSELVKLFNVLNDNDETIMVDQAEVDYNTPGNYSVTFTDESGNEFAAELEIRDVLPTLVVDESEISIYVGGNVDDILIQLDYTATEITDGDLTELVKIDDSNIDYQTAGSYELKLNVIDAEGNVVSQIVTVAVKEDEVVIETGSEEVSEVTDSESSSEVESEVIDTEISNEDDNLTQMELASTGEKTVIVLLGLGAALVVVSCLKKQIN